MWGYQLKPKPRLLLPSESPILLFKSHPGLRRNPGDIVHSVWIAASENHRLRRIDPLLQHRERAVSRQFRGERVCFSRRQSEDVPKHIVRPACAERRIVAVAGCRTAHRRNIDEVEEARRFNVEQLAVIAELFKGSVRVYERIAGRRRRAANREVSEAG